jgi:hypothetical protein
MKHEQHQFDGDQQSEHFETKEFSEKKENQSHRIDNPVNGHEKGEVAPGVPIVRSNTPRPVSFETMMSSDDHLHYVPFGDSAPFPVFPSEAPEAPPLPEELTERSEEGSLNADNTPLPLEQVKPVDELQEFVWLFEYGLEMDASILNSPERLDGLAFLYGPAVLKGYSIVLGAQRIHGSTGQTVVAIVPSLDAGAEVWGVLYRIPGRLMETTADDPSLLDTIHAAITPQNFFKGVEVVVHETYRAREVTGLTYVATEVASQQLHLVSVDEWRSDTEFVQRLASIARKHKLPESYIEHLLHASLVEDSLLNDLVGHTPRDGHLTELYDHHTSQISEMRSAQMTDVSSSHMSSVHSSRAATHSTKPVPGPTTEISKVQNEQNTEPLPVFSDRSLPNTGLVPRSFVVPQTMQEHRWLVAFALYLVSLLLIALTFAILQGLGMWSNVLTSSFTPLGVPWLVMMYGLLGGCVSSIITLGRFRADCPPVFVIITWFTRPFIGSLLAVLSYTLLTSGIFTLSRSFGQHMALCLLVGALAGLAEGWIFFKRG